ncbi:hypothetical protein WJX73_000059 [Symbiochloris irregularis]|uniref:Divalent-cation tolerance protein CutA n=1 Tax=Symbiochloris irregularis TaxID=706552 RepID=A0AAW1NSP7_9CHLO
MGSASTAAAVVYVTVPDREVAKKISHGLVESKLAACVNIVPGLQSIYMWEGKVNDDAELLLMIKTGTQIVERLTEYVKANHPYDECEVISVPITGGSQSYISWIEQSTQGS